MNYSVFYWFAPLGSITALLTAFLLARRVLKESEGTEKMVEIAQAVREGASGYLKQQYKVVAMVFAILFLIFLYMAFGAKVLPKPVPFAFLTGGFFSGLSGFIGMTIATRASARTANAARTSLNKALRIAFFAGAVMGLTVVGLALLDLSIWFKLLEWIEKGDLKRITMTMLAFGMGASTQALFARVGGGIYTKAADVGADLVGKVEAGIPEDDPRNPATIADNVGDNVGDVAGMGADLYESYADSIIATMALGTSAAVAQGYTTHSQMMKWVVVPMIVAGIGVISSIIGIFFVRTREEASQDALLWALRRGTWGASLLMVIGSYIMLRVLGMESMFLSLLSGLIAGIIIGYSTEYFTSDNYRPVKSISTAAKTGPATVVLQGMAVAMYSTWVPIVTVVVATLLAYAFAGGFTKGFSVGLYGIGLAAVGMLSTLGITLATDAYGPVADNAGGNAEMAGLPPEVRERTDALDALGNTTAATGKGFAIGSAALTALALVASYRDEILHYLEMFNMKNSILWTTISQLKISISDPIVISGIFLGAMLPFLFSSLAIQAVSRAAGKIIEEVRRQFREIPGILEGKAKPDYAAAVKITTAAAQKEMLAPAFLAILAPILTGILLGPKAVFGLLIGALTSGFVLAIYMANAGGAWDNAKKFIEKGNLGGKGSEPHKAAVIGDTVGDPLKDTAGPSLNILIKLMSMVSIVFTGFVIKYNIAGKVFGESALGALKIFSG